MPDNKQLAEVLCGIWFDPTTNSWDSTYWGLFFEKIFELGYRDKEEQVIIPQPNGGLLPNVSGSRMIFKNSKARSAIILAPHFISFHKMSPYESWDHLIAEIVMPGLKIYQELGLGKNPREVQSLYLNKYVLTAPEKITDYLFFIPTISDTEELSISFQNLYGIDERSKLLLKVNGTAQNNEYFFECSCTTKCFDAENVFDVAEIAHRKINEIHDKIIKQ